MSGKHLEDIDHAHIISLMYKLLTSSRGSDDLPTGFDRSRDRRKQELTNNKNVKGKNHVRIVLKDKFSFVEHQEKATFGLGYGLTLTRNSDNAVLNKGNATNNGKFKIFNIDWYASHYIPSVKKQGELMKQIVDKTTTDLRYPERSVFLKEVNSQNLWIFELSTQEGFNVSIWMFVAFQQSDRQHDENLSNDTFSRLPVVSAQVIIGTENSPDVGILRIYNDDE